MAISLQDAKAWLRVDHDADDNNINLLIRASKSFVESYLNRSLDEWGENYPDEFDVTMLYIIQQWYDQKAITTFSSSEEKGLGFAFSLILDRHRFKKFAFLGYPNYNAEDGLFGYTYTVSDTLPLD